MNDIKGMKKNDRVVIYPVRNGGIEITSQYYAKTGKVMGYDKYFVYVQLDDGALRAFGYDEIKILKGEV